MFEGGSRVNGNNMDSGLCILDSNNATITNIVLSNYTTGWVKKCNSD